MQRIAFKGTYQRIQASASSDLTAFTMRVVIILVALLFIVLALSTKNKFVLAAILAYIVLP